MRWILLVLLLSILGAALALHQSWIRLPPKWAPWAAPALEAEPGWFARFQINGLAADPGACRAALERARVGYVGLPERPVTRGCGLVDAVRLAPGSDPAAVTYDKPFAAVCALAAALVWWQRRLDAQARKQLGSGLARIDHLGSYACRNVNSRASGRRSEHATANAIDVAGFRLEDGRRISVLDDWGRDAPEGRFLRVAHDEACRFFNTVLGPEHNALHANHFHLDLGRFRVCR